MKIQKRKWTGGSLLDKKSGNKIFFKQGSIISIVFDPTLGHEQKGRRPAIVVSNDKYSNMTEIMPITRTKRLTPMLVSLDERTDTIGYIMIDQSRSVDLSKRDARFIEMLPNDLLDEVLVRFLLRFEKNK